MIKKTKQILLNKKLFKSKSLKDFSAIVGSNLISYPIALVKSLLVAKFLGPSDFGILQSTKLITMLNKFGKLGFTNVAVREIGVLKGKRKSNKDKEKLIKNTAYSSEMLLAVLLTIIGIMISMFSPPKYTLIIFIASIGMFVNKIRGIFTTEATIQRRFTLIAKITLLINLLVSIIVSIAVPFLKIYAALITPIIVIIGVLLFYKNKIKFNFSFNIKKKEFIHQLKIGIPLSIGSLAYGSYVYVERILIISFLSVTDLGYFGFATMVSNQFITIFLTAIKVRKMNILEYLGRGDYQKVNKLVIKETILLIIGSFFVILFVWFIISLFVPIFLKEYIGAIIIVKLFILVLPIKVLSSYLAIVVKSPIVNKQSITPIFQFLATGSLFLVAFIMHKQGTLTLKTYIIVDLFGYAFEHFSFVIMYYKFFYLDFVKRAEK